MPARDRLEHASLRAGLVVTLSVLALQAAALVLFPGMDFLPLVLLGGVVIVWLWGWYGGFCGGLALLGQVALIAYWSARADPSFPRHPVWLSAAVWWGAAWLYLYDSGRRCRRRLRRAGEECARLEGRAGRLREEIRKKEARLAASTRWLERLGGLVSLAEELLPVYRPAALARALETHVPLLLPPADRFFFFRGRGGELKVLAGRLPEGEDSVLRPDGLDYRVVEEMRPVLMRDPSGAPEGLDAGREVGSLVAVPLTARVPREAGGAIREALGLLRVEALAPGAYGPSDLEILKVVADLAAGTLHNAELYERREQLAVHDALTGLYLRQVFYERAAQDLSRARREGAQVCLAIFDIDDFKRFNDTWGHAAGDLVLRRIAGIVSAACAPGEIACRYGGEELALLLHQDVSRATRRVQNIVERAKAERYTLPDENGVLHEARATVSAGLAAFPLHADELVSLIRQADRALYRAKRLGKERLVVARSR